MPGTVLEYKDTEPNVYPKDRFVIQPSLIWWVSVIIRDMY